METKTNTIKSFLIEGKVGIDGYLYFHVVAFAFARTNYVGFFPIEFVDVYKYKMRVKVNAYSKEHAIRMFQAKEYNPQGIYPN